MSDEENKVRHLHSKGMASVHGVVTHLNERVEAISEIYTVVKLKDGSFYECISGDTGGMAFAVIVLQKHMLDILDNQLYE